MVNEQTPVEQVIKNRQLLIRLAQLVFGSSSTPGLQAISKFTEQGIGTLIDLKRKGIFDFMACAVDIDTGQVWPGQNRDSTQKNLLVLLTQPEAIQVDELLDCYEVPGREEDVKAHLTKNWKKILPVAAESGKKATKAAKAKEKEPEPVVQETVDPETMAGAEEPEEVVEAPAEPKVERFKPKNTKAEKPDSPPQRALTQASENAPMEAVLHKISQLRIDLATDLSDAVKKMDGANEARIASVEEKLDTLGTALQIVNQNLALVMGVGEDENFVHLSEEKYAIGVDFATGPDKSSETLVQVQNGKKTVVEAQPSLPIEIDEEGEEGTEEIEISEEELDKMTLQELRDLGEQVGVPNAQKLGQPVMLRRRIMQIAGIQ